MWGANGGASDMEAQAEWCRTCVGKPDLLSGRACKNAKREGLLARPKSTYWAQKVSVTYPHAAPQNAVDAVTAFDDNGGYVSPWGCKVQ